MPKIWSRCSYAGEPHLTNGAYLIIRQEDISAQNTKSRGNRQDDPY